MAGQSKFAGALGKLKQSPVGHKAEQTGGQSNGRGGKRSNPEFSPTTFFVRKDTKRKASRLLEDTNAGKDLSDLVEDLLEQWISKHSSV
jgi:hypothetical protein